MEVSPDLISAVTDAVMDEVREWQTRPLEAVYPILYLDALQVKIRDQGQIINKAIYLAIAVNMEGKKEVLGMWSSQSEGAKFWLSIITELQARGVQDFLIACVDGLKGLPQAIESVFPKTIVQTCLVHMVRNSLAFVSYKDRKEVACDLKLIYRGVNEAASRSQIGGVLQKVGHALSIDSKILARELVENRPDVQSATRDSSCRLHDKLDRIIEHDIA